MANELVVSSEASAYLPVLNVQLAVHRQSAITQYVKDAFIEGKDYGVIPGVSKPSLFKPGAEKLLTFFGLAAQFVEVEAVEDWTGAEHGGEPFFLYRYRCDMYRNGNLLGSGIGSCNSWESKYRYRNGERVCPDCGKATIIKGKPEYGGGWLCFAKKGGCGAKFKIDDPAIMDQQVGRVPNPDPADVVNTIDKMAQKRALVAGCLITVNASDYFTQDVEDMIVDGNYIDGAYTVTVVQPNGKGVVSSSAQSNGGGESNGTTTDKRQQHTPALASPVPAGTEVWRTWKNPNVAQMWACEIGACDNGHEALNSWGKVARDLFPKGFGPKDLPAVCEAFYNHQMQKLSMKQEKANADDNPFDDQSADSHETGLPSD